MATVSDCAVEGLTIRARLLGGESAECSFCTGASFAELLAKIKHAFELPDLRLKVVFGDRVLDDSSNPSATLSSLGLTENSEVTVYRVLRFAGSYRLSLRGRMQSDGSVGDWTELKLLRLGHSGDCQVWAQRSDSFLDVRIVEEVRCGTYSMKGTAALCNWSVNWSRESWYDGEVPLDGQLNIPPEDWTAWTSGAATDSEERLPFESDELAQDGEAARQEDENVVWKRCGCERCCLLCGCERCCLAFRPLGKCSLEVAEMIALGVPTHAAHELGKTI